MGDARKPDEQDFFVGYLPAMPAASRGATRRFVGAIVLCVCGVAVGAATLVRPPAPASWNASARVVTGVISAEPYPVLHIKTESGERAAILVGFGKAGAPTALRDLHGQQVSLNTSVEMARSGSLVYELSDANAATALGPGQLPVEEHLGRVRVRGEVIDPKCYAGTMKPGEGKIHRACAVRCISGGVPPVLASNSRSGLAWYVLTGVHGEPIGQDILDFVADEVEVEGEITRRGALLRLAIDPATIKRVE